MVFLIKAAQLLLSLSILVVLHELGHFIPARLFKTRVEKFYLFFDPWFSLWKTKKGDTEYGIGWLPLGGYVKISGMVDESMDKEQMALPAQPWEFRAKPAWQRLIIMIGGVTVNLLLGIVIYISILWVWGRDVMPPDKLPYGIHPSPTMQSFGLMDGDRILTVDGKKPESLGEAQKAIMIDDAHALVVERDGKQVTVQLPEDASARLMDNEEKELLQERFPFYVGALESGNGAELAGMLVNDRIIGVDGRPAPYFNDFKGYVKDLKDTLVNIRVERGDQEITIPVHVGDGIIGVRPMAFDSLIVRGHKFVIESEKFGFFQSIPAGISFGLEKLGDYVRSLKKVFTSSGAKQVGGFGSIGSMFPAQWSWVSFWELTAFLSIILAFMNILPIPALDGGHVMFLLYEIITRRTPNQKVMEYAQMVGMALLLCLVLFANGNDLFKAVVGK